LTHNEEIGFSFISVLQSAKMLFELLKIFDLPIKILQVHGLWPWKESAIYKRAFVAILVQTLFASFLILQICKLPELTNVEELSPLLAIMISYIIIPLKAINLTLKMNKIKNMLESLRKLMQNDFGIDEQHELNASVFRVQKFFKLYLVFALIAVTFNQLNSLLNHKLAYVMYMPANANDILFWVACVYQYVCTCSCVLVFVTLDYLPIIFMTLAIGFYKELCILIEKTDTQNLQIFIKIESKIRAFVDEIDDCFSAMILIQAFLSSIIFCTSVFALSHVSYEINN